MINQVRLAVSEDLLNAAWAFVSLKRTCYPGRSGVGSEADDASACRLAVLLSSGLPAGAVTASRGSVGGPAGATGQLSRQRP